MKTKLLVAILCSVFSQHSLAWTFGERVDYACFDVNSKKPIKMVISHDGDIQITWVENPVTYHFLSYGGEKLVTGGVWLLPKDSDKNVERFMQYGDPDPLWIRTEIISFDLQTKQLSLGEVETGKRVFMDCISVN